MNIMKLTGIEQDTPESNVGTPEEPLHIPAEQGLAKTGKAAQQSERDFVANLRRKGNLEDYEGFLPAGGRAARRAQQRAGVSQRRRMQRNFVRRELAKEREANHLAKLFELESGETSASLEMRFRARKAIDQRADAVVYADAQRFQREVRAGKEPRPTVTREQVRADLQALAGIA